jgi:hypothetical protein
MFWILMSGVGNIAMGGGKTVGVGLAAGEVVDLGAAVG